MTTTLEILISARAIVADPSKWTQGHLARDANGKFAEPKEAEACSFCAYGAALRAALDLRAEEREGHRVGRLLDSAAAKLKPEAIGSERSLSLRPIAFLNDGFGSKSRELVLKAYDIAIDRERAKEAAG